MTWCITGNIANPSCKKPSMKNEKPQTPTPPQNSRKRRSMDLNEDEPGALQIHPGQPNTTQSTLEISPTMVVPLKHFALMILIRDLQKKNNNFTLELIAAKF